MSDQQELIIYTQASQSPTIESNSLTHSLCHGVSTSFSSALVRDECSSLVGGVGALRGSSSLLGGTGVTFSFGKGGITGGTDTSLGAPLDGGLGGVNPLGIL